MILAVITTFRVHLISPFFAKTKGKSANSELQICFNSLYASLHHHYVGAIFFHFDKPVSFQPLYDFYGMVDTEYNLEILEAV